MIGHEANGNLEKLADGQVHVLHDASLMAPSVDDLVWDGESGERVEIDRPPFDALPIGEIFTPIHTAKDVTIIEDDWLDVCITCIEPSTTTSFRRGSARQWDDVVSVQKR